MKKINLGKTSYRDHTSIILEDGRSLKDMNTGQIFESPIEWVRHIDISEGRVPPSFSFSFDNTINFENRYNTEVKDDSVMERSIPDLIREMDENVAKLEEIALRVNGSCAEKESTDDELNSILHDAYDEINEFIQFVDTSNKQ